jgi:transposase
VLADKAYTRCGQPPLPERPRHQDHHPRNARIRKPVVPDAAQPAVCPRSFDAEAYKGRNVVERCFNRLKQWRGIATRFDKTARSYLVGLTLVAGLIWTR